MRLLTHIKPVAMQLKRGNAEGRTLDDGETVARGASMDQVYVCPMHSDVRQPGAGKCPKCGMDLLPEGTRFALFRHMLSSPLHLAVMAAVMVALMAAAMMMMR